MLNCTEPYFPLRISKYILWCTWPKPFCHPMPLSEKENAIEEHLLSIQNASVLFDVKTEHSAHSSHAVHWHSILFYHNLLPESY